MVQKMARPKRKAGSSGPSLKPLAGTAGKASHSIAGHRRWQSRRGLASWFRKLTPEQRLDIALEIEQFRREAVKVEA
ncbi:MAG: hypothetical protein KGI98_16205 [Euryarchaeota archaeon]|nr:hypothetical protein [Euryarchaeota archaeon]